MVNSYWSNVAAKPCKAALLVASVVGFPLGRCLKAKREETEKAVKDGAVEIDMVINIGELKAGICLPWRAISMAWSQKPIRRGNRQGDYRDLPFIGRTENNACLIAKEAGADFVKTSTGFSTGEQRLKMSP